MAKTFYYDSVGLLESTLIEGAVSGGTGNVINFSAGDSVTNPERATDQSLATAVTGWGQNDILQIDLGSAKTVDFFAVYFNAEEADDVELEFDSASTGFSDGESLDISSTFSANAWTVSEFSEQTKQYWRIIAPDSGGIVGLTEVIIGQKLEFEFNPDLGTSDVDSFNTEVVKSIGGVEYAVKNGNPTNTLTFNFSSVSSTFKTSLISMQDEVQNFKKFIYSENGTTGPFHYVRLGSPIEFKEVSSNRFSCNIKLLEQLS